MMCVSSDLYFFFFCKQKTAYEMRISDWSSDVCSSDLQNLPPLLQRHLVGHRGAGDARTVDQAMHGSETRLRPLDHVRRKGGIGHIAGQGEVAPFTDRKSTRLNSSP